MNDLALNLVITAQNQASGVLGNLGQTLSAVFGQTGLAGAALVGIGALVAGAGMFAAASTRMAADYQQAMDMVQSLTGASDQQMQQYDAGIKQLAEDTGTAPTDLAKGLYQVLSAGFKGAEAMQVLTLATKDAKIGMTDATTTGNALTTVLKAFNVSAGDTTRVNGEMLETVTLGKMTMTDYANSVGKAASTSMQFHVSMENMNASIATLTANGIPSARQAVTDYNQAISVMYGNIGTVTKSLHKNGIAFDEARFNSMSYADKIKYLSAALEEADQKHVKITGVTKQAAQAIQIISQHTKEFSNNLSELSNKQAMTDKTQQAWATTQRGLNVQMQMLGAKVQVLMIDLGERLVPAVTAVVMWVNKAIDAFGRFIGWLQQGSAWANVIKIVLIALAGGILGFAASAIPVLVAGFLAWAGAAAAAAVASLAAALPFILIGAVIALVVAGIILAIQHWGQITKWLQGVWNTVKAFFVTLWNDIKAVFTVALQFLEQLVMAMVLGVVYWFIWLYNHNYYFKDLVDAIVTFFKGCISWIQSAWSAATAWLQNVWSRIASIAAGVWNTIKGGVVSAWNFIVGIFQGVWGRVSGPLNTLWNNIKNLFQNLVSGAATWGRNLVQGFINGLLSMLGGVGNATSQIIGKVANIMGFHSPAKEGPGSDADTWAPNLMKMFIVGLSGSIPALQAQMNAVISPVANTLGNPTAGLATATSRTGNGQVVFQNCDFYGTPPKQWADFIQQHMSKNARMQGMQPASASGRRS